MITEYLTDEIKDLAEGNTAGTIISDEAINAIVDILIDNRILNKSFIDQLIAEHESETGYLVKSSNFITVLNFYLNSDHIDYGSDIGEWKGERVYEMIEILYGDYHSECGDKD